MASPVGGEETGGQDTTTVFRGNAYNQTVETTMRTFLLGLLTGSLVVCALVAMPQSRERETLNIGTDLTLGMSEDTAIKKLAESGHSPRKIATPQGLQAKGITSVWVLDQGAISFASGKLAGITKLLLPSDGNGVEFGRQLYFAMRDLELEGDSHCSITTEAAEVPDYSTKTGKLHCGKKTILIELQKFEKNAETVQLNEELGGTP
jgi:hypothetical protein